MFYSALTSYLLSCVLISAHNYVEVPDHLQNRYGIKIQYDYYTNADSEMYLDGKMTTCRIGGYGSKELINCFPFPESGTIPRYRGEETAKMMCDHFAKLHSVYWYHESLVWCDIRPQTIRIREVPSSFHGKYGKIIYYDHRSRAKNAMVSNDEENSSDEISSKTPTFKCRVGDLDSKNEMIDCFPFPPNSTVPKGDNLSVVKTRCFQFAFKYFVYWFEGRVVWCDQERDEDDPIQYRKGYYVLKVDPNLPKDYGDKIYYDRTTPAFYKMNIANGKSGNLYTCQFGYFVNTEFVQCFPYPKTAEKPRNKNKEIAEGQCKRLAQLHTVYWEGSRLVWCEPHGIPKNVNSAPIDNSKVKFVNVPEIYYERFGKILYYRYRTKAKYEIRLEVSKYSKIKGQARYVCHIGDFSSFNSSSSSTNNQFTDCFPYPGSRNFPQNIDEKEVTNTCKNFVKHYYVYWFDNRIVWCDREVGEFDPIPYRQGIYVLNVPSKFSNDHGVQIYYDYTTTPAVYKMIKDIIDPDEYGCKIGGISTDNEFFTCFPVPQRLSNPPGTKFAEVERTCKKLAKTLTLYWDESRLVWCKFSNDTSEKRIRIL